METVYIYDTDGFDDGNFTLIDSFTGNSNQDCDQWVQDNNYDDPDLYAVSFTKVN